LDLNNSRVVEAPLANFDPRVFLGDQPAPGDLSTPGHGGATSEEDGRASEEEQAVQQRDNPFKSLRVAKVFPSPDDGKEGVYFGKVEGQRDMEGERIYHIAYDDGDAESVDFEELQDLLCLREQCLVETALERHMAQGNSGEGQNGNFMAEERWTEIRRLSRSIFLPSQKMCRTSARLTLRNSAKRSSSTWLRKRF